MKLANLTRTVENYEIRAELYSFEGQITVYVTMPSGLQTHRFFDVDPLMQRGMSTHDALDYTLRAVCLGLEAGIQHAS